MERDLYLELLELFIRDTTPLIKEICTAVETENMTDLIEASHVLKGSSITLGADHLSHTALQLETRAKGESTDDPSLLFSHVKQAWEDLKNFVEDHYPDIPIPTEE